MSYQLTSQNLLLPTKSGETLVLRITDNSGRIVTRKKIDTVFGVDHPGIELAVDQYGRRWVAHHHYKNQYPTIDCEEVYADGNAIHYDNRLPYFSQQEILERALHYWWNGQSYKLLMQNCQHFVNIVAFDEHRSDSLDKASDAMLLGSGLSLLFGLLTGNKTLLNVGAGLAIAGGATKLVSTTSSKNQLPPSTYNYLP